MRIEHVAVWTNDLERLRAFYEEYFGARAGALYRSATRAGFTSYFLTFPAGGARVELMSAPGLSAAAGAPAAGYAHLALSLGSEAAVEALAARLRREGSCVVSGPRRQGQGLQTRRADAPRHRAGRVWAGGEASPGHGARRAMPPHRARSHPHPPSAR